MYKKKYFFKTCIVFAYTGLIFLLPFFFWKYINFDNNFFHSIFSAVPRNLPGYESFNESLSSCGYRCFPLWILLPPSINEFTQTFGLVSIFFILLIFGKVKYKIQIMSLVLIYFIIGLKFGQSNPRFFLEPLIWMLIWLIVHLQFNNIIFNNLSKFLIIPQSLMIILILVVSSFFLFPGSLNSEFRKNVMNEYANGYSLFKWSSSVIPKNAKVISSHRSIGLSEHEIYPLDFLLYISKSKDIDFYLHKIKLKKPNYLLTYGNSENYFGFKKCVIKKIQEKRSVGKTSTRNFYLNNKRKFYNGYIYLIDYNKLPGCYEK